MSATAKQILTLIYQLKGSGAKDRVKNIYNNYASKHNKSKTDGKAWCSETVSAGFIKANATSLINGVAQTASAHVDHFKKLNIWKSGHTRTPNVGDIVIFQDSKGSPNHTEMVFSVNKEKGIFVGLSGNYLGGIGLRTRKINATNIHGYGCPRYTNYKIINTTIVEAILQGKYGTGAKIGTTRYNKLALEGYDPDVVQEKVRLEIKESIEKYRK